MAAINEWRRKLLQLQQAEQQARQAVLQAQQQPEKQKAQRAMHYAEEALTAHYLIRPPG